MSNGAKLAALSKKTRGEAVQVRMTFRMGDEKAISHSPDRNQRIVV